MKKEKNISEILKKYYRGECNISELNEAISILKDPSLNKEIEPEFLKIWNSDNGQLPGKVSQKELQEILDTIHHQVYLKKKAREISKTKRIFINISKIAAVLIIGALIGIFSTRLSKPDPVYYTSFSPNGSVSQMVLPDNTVVYLNSGSELKYQLNQKNKREVYLEGEAWFDVEKDKTKEFIVHTDYYDVIVMGTQFNVKAYAEDKLVTTTLEEGMVRITSSEKLKINNARILKPGEQLVYDKDTNGLELKKVDTRIFTSWRENKLIFIDMSLENLIVLLERKYGVKIHVDDSSLLDLHYDGTIRNETITEVMDIIQKTLPVKYKIENQEIHIIETE